MSGANASGVDAAELGSFTSQLEVLMQLHNLSSFTMRAAKPVVRPGVFQQSSSASNSGAVSSVAESHTFSYLVLTVAHDGPPAAGKCDLGAAEEARASHSCALDGASHHGHLAKTGVRAEGLREGLLSVEYVQQQA